jgi:hypothetical protein
MFLSKTFFVTILVLIANACTKSKSHDASTSPTATPIPSKLSPQSMGGTQSLTIENFYSIANLSYGDSFDKALTVLGSPILTLDEPSSSSVIAYYGPPSVSSKYSMQIGYWRKNRALNSIMLKPEVKPFLKSKNIDDVHTQVFAMKYSDVTARFGAPSVKKDPVFWYEHTKAGKGRIQVIFWCVGDSTANCSSVQAIWNGTDSL